MKRKEGSQGKKGSEKEKKERNYAPMHCTAMQCNALTAKYICCPIIASSSLMRVTGTLNSLSPSSYSILKEPSSLI